MMRQFDGDTPIHRQQNGSPIFTVHHRNLHQLQRPTIEADIASRQSHIRGNGLNGWDDRANQQLHAHEMDNQDAGATAENSLTKGRDEEENKEQTPRHTDANRKAKPPVDVRRFCAERRRIIFYCAVAFSDARIYPWQELRFGGSHCLDCLIAWLKFENHSAKLFKFKSRKGGT